MCWAISLVKARSGSVLLPLEECFLAPALEEERSLEELSCLDEEAGASTSLSKSVVSVSTARREEE